MAPERTKTILKTLKNKKYLTETSSCRGRSGTQRGKVKTELVTEGPLYQMMMREYFDPSSKIAHHVCHPFNFRNVWTYIANRI